MRLFIAPYKMGSESAKALAQRLRVLRVTGSKSFKRSDVIINWGKSRAIFNGTHQVLNPPASIAIASNKLDTFQRLSVANVATVEWTTSKATAELWKSQEHTVMARKIINGSQGAGLEVIIPDDNQFVDAPLYTKYIKAHEYRVHVFNHKVIDIQKKKRREGGEANPFIKNSASGWVFCREDVTAPLALYNTAMDAVQVLGLNFGAVDILYREAEDKVAVLEVNTSPGLEGQTLESYAKAIEEMLC